VDGVQVYPRRGHTIIASDPAWSKDARSLAFVETPATAKPRLVLLAEFDNPPRHDLGPSASASAPTSVEGMRCCGAGPGKLVVARSSTKPLLLHPPSSRRTARRAEHFKNAGHDERRHA